MASLVVIKMPIYCSVLYSMFDGQPSEKCVDPLLRVNFFCTLTRFGPAIRVFRLILFSSFNFEICNGSAG